MKKDILRVIDANFNRSREGLRVCEDVARFVWNKPLLTKELKSVRHRRSAILEKEPSVAKILRDSRDTACDVGRAPRSKSEMRRCDISDIFSANIERVKESIRVLEEFFKLVDKKNSIEFTKLRFKVYEIEKKAL